MNVASFLFFPLHFRQLNCHNFFFLSHFRQCHCHNWFPFRSVPLAYILGTSQAGLAVQGRTRISVISLPKFNFLSPLTHCTFSCNFGNIIVEIHSLSSFCQITLNSTYNNNKLFFFFFFGCCNF